MNKPYFWRNFFLSQIDVINVSKIQQIYCYFMDFRKVNPPTIRPSTTYPPTHQLPTQRLAESIIVFERLDNRNIFILQNTNTARKAYNYTSVNYPKRLLVSIKQIWRSQLYLFFWFLNFSALLLPRYFKVTFCAWFFFSSQCEYYIVS